MDSSVKVKKILDEHNLDAALISSPANIIYFTNFSSFSSEEREGYLLVTKKNNYVITDARYTIEVKKQVKNFTLLEISHGKKLENILSEIANKEHLQTLGIEANNITISEYKKVKKSFQTIVSMDISHLRIIKTAQEITHIKHACLLGDMAFDYICKRIKSGVTEKELAFDLEFFIRKKGAQISFRPIVAFSEHAAIPHHQPTNRKLRRNEAVLLDFGVRDNNFCSDMTRTILYGKATKTFKNAYQVVLSAQEKAIQYIKSMYGGNIAAAKVDTVARNYIISQGYTSIPHSLGHGIGLEVHEAPHLSLFSTDVLQEGMVFSIEPGIYVENHFGIRIEDLFTLKKNEIHQLTNAPKNLVQIDN